MNFFVFVVLFFFLFFLSSSMSATSRLQQMGTSRPRSSSVGRLNTTWKHSGLAPFASSTSWQLWAIHIHLVTPSHHRSARQSVAPYSHLGLMLKACSRCPTTTTTNKKQKQTDTRRTVSGGPHLSTR